MLCRLPWKVSSCTSGLGNKEGLDPSLIASARMFRTIVWNHANIMGNNIMGNNIMDLAICETKVLG